MIAYENNADKRVLRPHPWTYAESNPEERYVDFKVHPELIRASIIDLMGFHLQPFAEALFRLLTWLNSAGGSLESNDCAFRGPEENTDKQFRSRLRAHGRLMILYRGIVANTQSDSIDWLYRTLLEEIAGKEPGFKLGAIGLSKSDVDYRVMHDNPRMAVRGQQVTMTFYAYGNTQGKCLQSMLTVITGLHAAFKGVDRRLKNGEHVPDLSRLLDSSGAI